MHTHTPTLLTHRYQHYLRRARTENFSDMSSLGAFYKAGLDYVGRQVVVFVGRQFPAPKLDISKVCVYMCVCVYTLHQALHHSGLFPSNPQAMAYFVHVMETVVSKDYILVYFHTLSESENQADSSFFKQLYNLVDERYKTQPIVVWMVYISVK